MRPVLIIDEAQETLTTVLNELRVPDLDRGPSGCDSLELQAARAVVEICDVLLALLAEDQLAPRHEHQDGVRCPRAGLDR